MNNQEICRFVNSKDIRKYLADINYSFTTAEAAWLVYQCRNATLAEKYAAWEKIDIELFTKAYHLIILEETESFSQWNRVFFHIVQS